MDSTTTRAKPQWLIAVCLFAGSVIVYWTGNNWVSLWDRDEPRFAQPAKEMLFSSSVRDWIVPHFNNGKEGFFHKPPWCYWQIALAYRLFGVNEFAARFFSGLWMATSGVLVFHFGRQWSQRAGLLSAVALLTTVLAIAMAKMAIADSTLLLCTLLTVFALWHIYTGTARLSHRLIFWVSMGLAGLVKGPAILVVVGPLIVGLLIVETRRRWFWRLGWLWGVPVMLAIALPWYVAAAYLDSGLVDRFVMYDILKRIWQPLESHRGWPGFYIVVGLLDLWPWSAFLAPVMITAWRRRSEPIMKFLLCWLVCPTFALECVSTKMLHYWLGVLPAYCLLFGLAAEAWFDRSDTIWQRWSSSVRNVVVATFLVLAVGLFAMSQVMFGCIQLGLAFQGTTLAILAVISLMVWRRSLGWAVGTVAGSTAVAVLVAYCVTLPGLEQYKFGKHLADKMRDYREPGRQFALVSWREPSTIFYLNEGTKPVLTGWAKDVPGWMRDSKLILAMPIDDYEKLIASEPSRSAYLTEMGRLSGVDYTRNMRRLSFVILRNEIQGTVHVEAETP